jgi:hypothetical protein
MGGKPKIRVTRKVRELLVELDSIFEQYHEISKKLADNDYEHHLSAGYDRELQKGIILGCAWRINKASKGIEE